MKDNDNLDRTASDIVVEIEKIAWDMHTNIKQNSNTNISKEFLDGYQSCLFDLKRILNQKKLNYFL